MKKERTLLAVFAHPDDEVFGIGGTLARYAAEGVHVVLICATRGEVGEIAEGTMATPETLGQVREEELRCAAEALGIHEIMFLGYRDSGMTGTPENDDPRAFMNAPSDEVVAQLVGIIRQVRPQVVITFDPDGGYGHPDHIAIHHHTLAAFDAVGDPLSYLDQGPSWMPDRLFYTVISRSLMSNMRIRMEELGLDTSEFDSFEEMGEFGWPDSQIHLTLDASASVHAKWKAFDCHHTQFSGDNLLFRLPEMEMKQILRYEHLALARPETSPKTRLADLFGSI